MQPTGILFVCLGNICRSPMAESVARRRIEESRLGHRFAVGSCGTAGFNAGKGADPRALAALRARGYALEGHVARQLHDADFLHYRHIVAMDRGNLVTLKGWTPPGFTGEIRLLPAGTAGASVEVADPYHAGEEAFLVALTLIERGVAALLAELGAPG